MRSKDWRARRGRMAAILSLTLALLAPGSWAEDDQHPAGPPQNTETRRPTISAPRPKFTPDPEYTPEARKAHTQGTVLLSVIVGTDGKTRSIKVISGLSHGLDEKAVEAVSKWELEPAMKDGKPVAVQLEVSVDFRLYGDYCCLVEVPGNTMSTDLDTYFASVVADIRKRWLNLLPRTSDTPKKEREVIIELRISRKGRAKDVGIASSSGDDSLDRAARDSIVNESPFQPMPAGFKGNEVTVRMHFLYNSAGVRISPDVAHVTAGSSEQFLVAAGSLRSPAVDWSIRGEGCSGSACGTISADGLYTAPLITPEPAIIEVQGALRVDPSTRGTAVVEIIPAAKSD